MARIPDEEIERLKAEVDLAELVTRSGVVLEAKGRDLVGRCPFHDDDTPSLVVTPSKGLWHCLGACQVGGSAIDWVMKAQGVSFRHAVEVLRCDVDPVIVAGRRGSAVAKTSRAGRLPSPLDVTAEDRSVLADVVDYYHRTLLDSPEALAYLTRRKIDDQEVTSRFRLGLRQPHPRLPAAGQTDQRRRPRAGPAPRAGCAAGLGPRALHRFARRPRHRPRGHRHRALRPQDHLEPAHRTRRPISTCRARTEGCGTRMASPVAR